MRRAVPRDGPRRIFGKKSKRARQVRLSQESQSVMNQTNGRRGVLVYAAVALEGVTAVTLLLQSIAFRSALVIRAWAKK